MMYSFMTLGDKTEVVHSETFDNNGVETVKVYFEKPVYGDSKKTAGTPTVPAVLL